MVEVSTPGGVRLRVHRQIAPLVQYLLEETERRGYRLRVGQCWGYANRPIKGSTVPSNHSWGLAVDLNAPTNPMGEDLVTDMPPWMPALWRAWGFTWGGSYRGRKDPMHYEWLGTHADTNKMLAKLVLVAEPPPVRLEVPPMLEPFTVVDRVVATLKAPGGGVWLLDEGGHIYGLEGAPDHDMPARHPEYWRPGQKARRLDPLLDGYRVTDSEGHFYEYPGG